VLDYRREVELPLDRDRVALLFEDPQRRLEWQPGLLGIRRLEGDGGTGTVSELRCEIGARRIVMIETVLIHERPTRYAARYAAEGVDHAIEYRFEPAANATRWTVTGSFSLGPLLVWLAPVIAPLLHARANETIDGFRDFVTAIATAERTD
jgi:hypothetical protein